MILLDSLRLHDLVAELHQHAELVIMVGPALLAVADTLLLAKGGRRCSARRARRIDRRCATAIAARTMLDQASIRMAGVVLTGAVDEPLASWSGDPMDVGSPVFRQRLWWGTRRKTCAAWCGAADILSFITHVGRIGSPGFRQV
jgi:hypothetical protein